MKKRILIIDENINEYKSSINVLENEYEVDAVGYMQTADYKLEGNSYDLIVLDIMMPPFELYSLEETSDGLKTGFVYYEDKLKSGNTPVLFWSWNSDFEKEIGDKKENNDEWKKTEFLLKEIDDDRLLKGINHFFETFTN